MFDGSGYLAVIGIMVCFNMLYYLRSERSWDFVYGIFYSHYSAFALFWIFSYAVLTVRAKSWLTRCKFCVGCLRTIPAFYLLCTSALQGALVTQHGQL